MSDEWINQISDRYIELYETVTGQSFVRSDTASIPQRIEENIRRSLAVTYF
jgi:phosphoribosylaminoimidazole-succinocarboxamide synthase